jgi:hypothetical protein
MHIIPGPTNDYDIVHSQNTVDTGFKAHLGNKRILSFPVLGCSIGYYTRLYLY